MLSKGGLGIGLALAKRLTEMHGGTITVQSEGAGQGSAFLLRLPLMQAPVMQAPVMQAPVVQAPVMQAENEPQPEQGTAPLALDATSRRILVVDDNHDAAESLAALLSHVGHETLLAHDGLDAIDKAAAF